MVPDNDCPCNENEYLMFDFLIVGNISVIGLGMNFFKDTTDMVRSSWYCRHSLCKGARAQNIGLKSTYLKI